MLGTILIVVLLLAVAGRLAFLAATAAAWGYYPSGTLGLVLVIVLVLAVCGTRSERPRWRGSMTKKKLFDDIKHNPTRIYRTPGDVLRDRRFGDAERLEILRAWRDAMGATAGERRNRRHDRGTGRPLTPQRPRGGITRRNQMAD